MKLAWRDIDAFLKKLDPKMRAVLVYGPDSGLVQERAMALCKQVVTDVNDPFNAAHLTGEIIAADQARLTDEANAQSLMGGMRLLRITSSGNDISPALKVWLKGNPNPECVIIIEAGDLKPKDALRKLCEEATNAAALPCYVEDERGLATLVKDRLREMQITIQGDALAWFSTNIKGDRLRARMEIEKLVLYMDGYNAAAKAQHKNVTLDDVKNSCGELGTQSIDDVVYAFGNREAQQSLRAFTRLSEEGVVPVTIIRSLQNHVLRLHAVKSLMELHGQSLPDAMKTLQPPVFFKQADQFAAQLRLYSLSQLRELLFKINALEVKSKQSGQPVELLISNFLLDSAA